VPPIFQPEVAAEAIVWAAQHRRNELWVGWPAVKAIWGNTLIPRELDYYLARTGYDSQQTDEPVDQDRKDNLWEPLPGDHGAHGSFDNRAHRRSYQWWANTHRGGLALAGTALAMLTGAALARR
jgi:hypothetical protein